jgi:hypothetical protein
LTSSILITAIPVLIDLIFGTHLVKEAYYYIVTPGILLRLGTIINTDRLYQINFDTDTRNIEFHFKSFLSKSKRKTLSFDKAKLEISLNKSATWLFEPLTLYFLKNKMEVFEIKKSKDGFSIDKLEAICKEVEKLSLPMTKL